MPQPPTSGLDKVVVSMDLSKGLDESVRPELLQDKVGIAELNNMVQDQNGAWVKRPGLASAGYTEENGYTPVGLRKVVKTVGGTSAIQDDGTLYDTGIQMNFVENLRKKNRVARYGVSGRYVASSGVHTQYAGSGLSNVGVRVLASTSNTIYDVVVVDAGPSDGGQIGHTIIIYNKRTNTETVRYPLVPSTLSPSLDANVGLNVRIAFSSTTLHVWLTGKTAGVNKMFSYVIPCVPLPLDTSSITATTVASGFTVNDHMCDIASDNVGNTWTALKETVYRMDTSSVVTSGTFQLISGDPASNGVAHSLYYKNNTGLWIVGKSNASKFLAVKLDPTTMAWSRAWEDAAVADVAASWWAVAGTSSGTIGVTRDTNATFGSTTIPKLEFWTADAEAATALTVNYADIYGWRMVSCPWYSSDSDEYFIHMSKFDLVNSLTPHVVVNLSSTVRSNTTPAAGPLPYRTAALDAVLEPYNATSCMGILQLGLVGSPRVALRSRYIPYTDSFDGLEHVSPACAYQSVSRSAAIVVFDMFQKDWSGYASETFGGSSYISGGVPSLYDGSRVVEQGFADYPVTVAADSGVAGVPSGLYNYVAVFRFISSRGEATYSRTYGPVSISVVSKKVRLTIQPYCVGNKESGVVSDQRTVVDLYRTAAGGTQYQLVATSQYDVQAPTQSILFTGAFWTVDDNMSDATLGAQPVMYRQPGIGGAPLDRHIAPASKVIASHKDRLFVTDPYGQRVFYSSFFVDGESAWFNPSFSFQVHGGTGPITGLASMDGRLVVFRKDCIWLVDGDGPAEGGGNGTEFSPPSKLSCEYGCIDHRSIVLTPEGIVYRSSRGIELLTRSLQVVWIGEKVQNTSKAYPYTAAAFIDEDSRVNMILWSTENFGAGNCKQVVFHMDTQAWSTFTYASTDAIRHAMRTSEGVRLVSTQAVYKYSSSDKRDGVNSNFVASKLKTGFIKVSGPQGRQRIYEVMVLAKNVGNHALSISIANDYSSTPSYNKVWEPSYLNALPLEWLNANPTKQATTSIQVTVEDQLPADTVTYPPGNGFELIDIAFEAAAKQHTAKLPVGSKG